MQSFSYHILEIHLILGYNLPRLLFSESNANSSPNSPAFGFERTADYPKRKIYG
jgi:hypothetical protein